jgi:hypothetical protein
MSYALVKFLASGTFTTGVSLDWRAQFSASTIQSPYDTSTGAISIPGVDTTYGIYAYIALESKNPFDHDLCIKECSVGAPVQVWMNGNLISELTVPGTVTVAVVRGPNILELVRSISPLVMVPSGVFLDPMGLTTTWLSPFAPGSDPFGGGGSGFNTTPATPPV